MIDICLKGAGVVDSITVEEFSRDPMAFVDQVADRHRSLVITKGGGHVADEWRSAGRLP